MGKKHAFNIPLKKWSILLCVLIVSVIYFYASSDGGIGEWANKTGAKRI